MDLRDVGLWLAARVPLVVADGLAWLVAWTWWWLVPVRRAVAVDNLTRALPGVPARPTLTRMMHDIVLGYFELLQYERGRVVIEMDATAVPPGSLLVAGHGGSWDLGLVASADALPLSIFLRTPTNRWARDRLAALRARHDVGALLPGTTLDAAYAALEAGRSVFFVQDQRYARGIDSPFFGRPARTSTGLATAALRTGRPVYAAWPVRLGRGRHRIQFVALPLPAPTGDHAADRQAITDQVNRWYEAQIRAYPPGWLWLHRRWQ